MKALCVDNERIPLMTLKKAVQGATHISAVADFEDEEEALAWAKANPVDVAFLDIELHEMNGLELAQELIRIHPKISIVFCTGYEQYAVRAMKMHIDAGYLIKPFRAQQVQEEIDHIFAKRVAGKKLMVQCFGDFEVFIGGKPAEFKRKKTKELLAYLIDRRGSAVTTAKIVTVLWEGESDDKKRDILYHLVSDLRRTLEEDELEHVFLSQNNQYSVNTGAIDCEFYRMLEGDEQARRLYSGEYMHQYSWAEYTNSWLGSEFTEAE